MCNFIKNCKTQENHKLRSIPSLNEIAANEQIQTKKYGRKQKEGLDSLKLQIASNNEAMQSCTSFGARVETHCTTSLTYFSVFSRFQMNFLAYFLKDFSLTHVKGIDNPQIYQCTYIGFQNHCVHPLDIIFSKMISCKKNFM